MARNFHTMLARFSGYKGHDRTPDEQHYDRSITYVPMAITAYRRTTKRPMVYMGGFPAVDIATAYESLH